MKVRFISPTIHGIIDYVAAVLLIVSPFALGLGSSSPLAIWLSVAGGLAVIVYSLITDYHYGIVKVIPFGGHLAIDLLAGVAFTLSPFLFRFQGKDAAYYFLNAAVIYLVVALTASEANKIRKSLTTQRGTLVLVVIAAIALYSCTSSAGASGGAGMAAQRPALPVLSIINSPLTTYREFTASLEGTQNVAIHPQVDGYLEKIYVEEGAYVTKSQPLFAIDSRPFDEQLNNARANLVAAKANLANARINLDKVEPLVENHVVSDVQLKTAMALYDAAAAGVGQAEAVVNNAEINRSYTLLKAPVNGYIGRIHFKTGALVGKGEAEPLTVVSDVKEVYAYFGMSESDFLQFTSQFPGKTIDEKIKALPSVELELADNSIYPAKGHIELMEGQFDRRIGAITFRATFPNSGGMLRSGITGKVRIPQGSAGLLPVPQTATYEIQDRIYVFAVGDSDKVAGKMLHVVGKTTSYYLVDQGVTAGDKIVFAGMDRLADGAMITPQIISADSLFKAMPL